MKLIIDIPESEQILNKYHIHMNLIRDLKQKTVSDEGLKILYDIVANGTPLPKGHGRLIDADELELDYDWCEYENDNGQLVVLGYQAYSDNAINTAPTIIEADKEESEE